MEQLAEFLGVPINTIYSWRRTGEGPKGYRIGKYVRFEQEEIMTWLATRSDEPQEG